MNNALILALGMAILISENTEAQGWKMQLLQVQTR
jgi:hypothetical protein